MLIGSKDSLSYLEPLKWWLKPFKWVRASQSATYKDQYQYCGVRYFDFRVSVNSVNGHIVPKSGMFEYSYFSLYEIFGYLNKQEDVTVKMTFDETHGESLTHKGEANEGRFANYCRNIELIYTSIHFCGGRRSFDDKPLYEFDWEKENGVPTVYNDKPLPWYSKVISHIIPNILIRRNRRLMKAHDEAKGFLMLSFVNLK